MISTNKKIIIAVAGLVFFAFGTFGAFYCVKALKQSIHNTQEYSAYSALETELLVLLMQYYEQNGSYPDSLFKLELEYSDGAHAGMLKEFIYSSNGKSCFFEYLKPPLSGREKTRVRYTFTEGKFPIVNYRDECF
jgi:hypothetical protein